MFHSCSRYPVVPAVQSKPGRSEEGEIQANLCLVSHSLYSPSFLLCCSATRIQKVSPVQLHQRHEWCHSHLQRATSRIHKFTLVQTQANLRAAEACGHRFLRYYHRGWWRRPGQQQAPQTGVGSWRNLDYLLRPLSVPQFRLSNEKLLLHTEPICDSTCIDSVTTALIWNLDSEQSPFVNSCFVSTVSRRIFEYRILFSKMNLSIGLSVVRCIHLYRCERGLCSKHHRERGSESYYQKDIYEKRLHVYSPGTFRQRSYENYFGYGGCHPHR